jgi:hypothetical protein
VSGISKFVVVWGLLGVLAPQAGLVASEIDPRGADLTKLAGSLGQESEAARYEFAAIAMEVLIDDYRVALERAYEQTGKTPREQRKLYRWRAATNTFVEQLESSREQLEYGAPLEIDATATGQVILYVGAHPIVVESPDVSAKGGFAGRVVDRYCEMFACPALVTANRGQGHSGSGRGSHLADGGYWSFQWNRGPRYESDDGLIFEFSDSTDRASKQRAAEALVGELRLLARTLGDAVRSGNLVDWAYLEVRDGDDGLGQRVMLNPQGDFLRLSLPLLAKIRLLPPELLTWLHGQVRGKQISAELLRAEELVYYENSVAARE